MSELERRVVQLLEMRRRAAAASDPNVQGELVRKGSDLASLIRALVVQRVESAG